jgi:energy-converting hydrogenase Eha subunit A
MSSQANSGGAKTGTSGNRNQPPGSPAATQPREQAGDKQQRDGATRPAGGAANSAAEPTAPRRHDAVGAKPDDNATRRIRPDKSWSAGDGPAAAGAGVRQDARDGVGNRPGGGPADSPTAVQPTPPSAPKQAPKPAPKPAAAKSGKADRQPRKAHLILRRIEPWSAMKFSFVIALVCFVVLFVAVAVLYAVLSGLGVFDSIISTVNQLTKGENGQASFDIASWFEPVRILGYTALLGAVNVVLITALSTLGAVIYNLSAQLVGGIEVTFSEAE